MPKENKPIDWEGIERDYRAGAMSVRDIARWYSVSHTAINKKAKAEKWVRAEQPKHLDRRELVPRLTTALETTPDLTEKGKTLAGRMMDELDAVTSLHGELEDMICAEESDSRRRHALLKAISLGERAKTLKDISATLKTFNEAAAPEGKKAQRQSKAEKAASGGRFAVRGAPTLAIDNTGYQARGKYVPFTARKTNWSDWLAVTTPDIRLTLADMEAKVFADLTTLGEWIEENVAGQARQTAADLIAETQARLAAIKTQAEALAAEGLARAEAILGEATARQEALTAEGQARAAAVLAEASARIDASVEQSARYRGVLGKIDGLMSYISNANFAAFTNVQQLRTTLVAQIGDVSATFDQRITAAVSATSAAVERVTSLEAKTGDLSAHIFEVDQARVDGENALASQINAVIVGTANQFDHASIWYFDQSVEGWTGNGAPTAAGGFLRSANHAGDAYVVSPVGLGIEAAKYTQVRTLVRKTGSPAWVGRLYWQATTDTTWSDARSVAVAAPVFDDAGIAHVTWNVPWTGTISQIRLDLSDAQTAASAFEVDWIGIGRPSPGASAAELIAERQARISAVAAVASNTNALQAELNSAKLQLSGVASGVTVLEGRVEEIDDTLIAQTTALTGVQADLEGKAGVDVVETLEATVRSIGTSVGALLAEGSATTARGDLTDVMSLASSNSQAIQSINSTLPNKADANALATLMTEVTQLAGVATATATALTQVDAELDGVTADSRFKAQAVGGPSGFAAVGLYASVTATSAKQAAGIYLLTPGSASEKSKVLVAADQFGVANITYNASGEPVFGDATGVFVVEGGKTYISSAVIPVLTTDKIIFGDGSVQETAMAQNATGERKFFASVDSVDLGASFTNLGAVTINKNDADYIEVDAVIRIQSSAGGTGLPSIEVVLRQSSTEVDSQIFRFSTVGELQVARLKYMVDTGNGSRTYSIIARVLSGNVFVGRRSLAAKRDKKSNA